MDRESYLNQLIELKHSNIIKVVTGIRRCGKSYLLFNLFATHLRRSGVDEAHIISIDLENYKNRHLRTPDALYDYVENHIIDNAIHYVLLDEVQMVSDFEGVLNGLLHISNLDLYVTGSNARFLSKDVITEFRGRGFEIRLNPLSFAEFFQVYNGSKQAALNEYMLYGGLPQILNYNSEQGKAHFLKSLFEETYLRDIKERYNIRNDGDLEELINFLASGIGGFTNPNKLSNTFKSVKQSGITKDTIKLYLDYLCDSFLIDKSTRYDVKGKRYIDTPYKYYFTDLGLRNARLNFRQVEPSHLMENLIYNELCIRGFNVDVGVVPIIERLDNGKQRRSQLEIDFVCNMGSRRYYVQSAYRIASEEKAQQERASLLKANDSFKKIIVIDDEIPVLHDDKGITTISIYDFLLKDNSLEL